jgi:hypothetical protein
MINEISNINDQQGQVNKPGSRHKDIQAAGTQTGKSGEFDIRDVVEISQLKPVQPVSEDKNEINFSPDAINAEKMDKLSGPGEGNANTATNPDTLQDGQNSVYGKRESGIGKFIDTVA